MKTSFVYVIAFCSCILSLHTAAAQQILNPGFNVTEYKNLIACDLHLYAADSVKKDFPLPAGIVKYYESPSVGLDNKITIWLQNNSTALISIRGTTAKPQSWLENFYSAMIPATGKLQINDSTSFNYKLAKDSLAYVHTGWTIGLSYIAPIAINKLNELYKIGVKNVIVYGHSQGGALAFLLRSHLEYSNEIPKDIKYKTYCSAAPKPGNLNYAYDFDNINIEGYAYRIVNALDWVPESPFGVQMVIDMNPINPLAKRSALTGKQSAIQKFAVNYAFNRMSKASKKTVKRYQKYLGSFVYKQIKKSLPQLKEPKYAPSNNYMTAGSPIVLQPNETYKLIFKQDGKQNFINHSYRAYLFLINKQFGN